MGKFKVEIAGICCHYTLVPGFIRTILVAAETHSKPHFAHLEVQATGVTDSAGLSSLPVAPEYTRRGTSYEAYRLNGHRISFSNIINSGPPTKQASFITQVPSLTNVCADFGFDVIQSYASPTPPTGLVAAHIDLPSGSLGVLEESELTRFEPVYFDPPQSPGSYRQFATVTELTLYLPDGVTQPTIKITPFGDIPRTLALAPWVRRIRIGNLGENGIHGKDEVDDEHFLIYYKMADAGSTCRAIPKDIVPGKGLGGGCTNNTYP
jgi:hypothetical protein